MNFQKLYDEARTKGLQALNACVPVPMTVIETDLSGNQIPGSEAFFVEDGECGFVWINIKPGNCPFASWLKKNGFAVKDSIYGGITVWVSEGNQSIARKKAFAEAFVEVLVKNDIKAYVYSRLD